MHAHPDRGRLGQGDGGGRPGGGGPPALRRVPAARQGDERVRRERAAHRGERGDRQPEEDPGAAGRPRVRQHGRAALRARHGADRRRPGRLAHQGPAHEPVRAAVALAAAHRRLLHVDAHARGQGVEGRRRRPAQGRRRRGRALVLQPGRVPALGRDARGRRGRLAHQVLQGPGHVDGGRGARVLPAHAPRGVPLGGAADGCARSAAARARRAAGRRGRRGQGAGRGAARARARARAARRGASGAAGAQAGRGDRRSRRSRRRRRPRGVAVRGRAGAGVRQGLPRRAQGVAAGARPRGGRRVRRRARRAHLGVRAPRAGALFRARQRALHPVGGRRAQAVAAQGAWLALRRQPRGSAPRQHGRW